ncbi:hypothetical protein IT072_02570 [Leifsonia sp. ZF2019]|uniref:hypothetical protein n=1 Tax=Leifsonia sp. ZF2019 TaxID=2781978 RepID=UPI001CBFE34A|nr:hypothetical protein [Leifsonia sp. ZF2019]UAJ79981.1 hypothetical protein IT072_02570 [Leifsonia sp. ZF2019]
MTKDELHERGNKLVTEARVAAVDAVRASMLTEFIEKHKTVDVQQLKRWRGRARDALGAWQRVDEIVSELLREVEKTYESEKASHD